jgi:transcriptional regulator with XRE-family HTH domain
MLSGGIMEGKAVRDILSSNIRLYRNRHGWSQAELAEKANISTNFLCDIETCKKWPHPETLQNLANGLKVEIYELFSPKQPTDRSIADTLSQYNDDAKLLISKSYTDLAKALDAMLVRHRTDTHLG